MSKPTIQIAKGVRDWYGEDAILRNKVRGTLRAIFESYGYGPIETPMLERVEVLGFKGGGEIQKEVFQLKDQGERDLALRFDQTVPLARFVATNKEFVKFPFKRYVIGEVFRDGPTQPEQGRYRIFTQCDVDVLGVKEMAAEAELFALAQDAFDALGLGGVEVKINNRKLLDGILDYAGVPDYAKLRTIVTLDKMDKIGLEGVRQQLLSLTISEEPQMLSKSTLDMIFLKGKDNDERKGFAEIKKSLASEEVKEYVTAELGESGYKDIIGMIREEKPYAELFQDVAHYNTRGDIILSEGNVNRILEAISIQATDEETHSRLGKMLKSQRAQEGLHEIGQLIHYAKSMDLDFIQFDPSLARGLDYYTGTTIEVFLKDRSIVPSAILAGGRFDDMVGDFRGGGEEIPAVGFSFGLERVVNVLKAANNHLPKTNTQLYIIPIGTTDRCLAIAHDLRKQGVNVDIALQSGKKIGQNIGYADSVGVPYVMIVGDNEIDSGSVKIKELSTGNQESLNIMDVGAYLKSRRG